MKAARFFPLVLLLAALACAYPDIDISVTWPTASPALVESPTQVPLPTPASAATPTMTASPVPTLEFTDTPLSTSTFSFTPTLTLTLTPLLTSTVTRTLTPTLLPSLTPTMTSTAAKPPSGACPSHCVTFWVQNNYKASLDIFIDYVYVFTLKSAERSTYTIQRGYHTLDGCFSYEILPCRARYIQIEDGFIYAFP